MNKPPSGDIGLSIGQIEVQINFPSFQPANFAFAYLRVEKNPPDSSPVFISCVPSTRTTGAGGVTGVLIELSAAPDDGNCVLRWGLAA